MDKQIRLTEPDGNTDNQATEYTGIRIGKVENIQETRKDQLKSAALNTLWG